MGSGEVREEVIRRLRSPRPPASGYRCILMDPPWQERGSGRVKRGAQRHYPLMGKGRILEAVRESGWWKPAAHAHLYLWVTNNKLVDGLWLLDQLEFRYVTNICWGKEHFGIGQYFRGKHELMLFAVRGKGKHPSVFKSDRLDLPSMIVADHVRDAENRRVHSAKPEDFHELIEARTRGPRIEFFARKKRKNWRVWGNQVEA